MAGLGDFVQKAFYLGVGIAASAGEKAGDLRAQAQKLADEMVTKGEITAEEARKLVDNMLAAQQQPATKADSPEFTKQPEPRRIEIQDEEAPSSDGKVDQMRRQVEELQEQLRRLKKP